MSKFFVCTNFDIFNTKTGLFTTKQDCIEWDTELLGDWKGDTYDSMAQCREQSICDQKSAGVLSIDDESNSSSNNYCNLYIENIEALEVHEDHIVVQIELKEEYLDTYIQYALYDINHNLIQDWSYISDQSDWEGCPSSDGGGGDGGEDEGSGDTAYCCEKGDWGTLIIYNEDLTRIMNYACIESWDASEPWTCDITSGALGPNKVFPCDGSCGDPWQLPTGNSPCTTCWRYYVPSENSYNGGTPFDGGGAGCYKPEDVADVYPDGWWEEQWSWRPGDGWCETCIIGCIDHRIDGTPYISRYVNDCADCALIWNLSYGCECFGRCGVCNAPPDNHCPTISLSGWIVNFSIDNICYGEPCPGTVVSQAVNGIYEFRGWDSNGNAKYQRKDFGCWGAVPGISSDYWSYAPGSNQCAAGFPVDRFWIIKTNDKWSLYQGDSEPTTIVAEENIQSGPSCPGGSQMIDKSGSVNILNSSDAVTISATTIGSITTSSNECLCYQPPS